MVTTDVTARGHGSVSVGVLRRCAMTKGWWPLVDTNGQRLTEMASP